MNNSTKQISDKILCEFDNLVKKAGVSKQEFLSYVEKASNINKNLGLEISDYNAYCDSFTA